MLFFLCRQGSLFACRWKIHWPWMWSGSGGRCWQQWSSDRSGSGSLLVSGSRPRIVDSRQRSRFVDDGVSSGTFALADYLYACIHATQLLDQVIQVGLLLLCDQKTLELIAEFLVQQVQGLLLFQLSFLSQHQEGNKKHLQILVGLVQLVYLVFSSTNWVYFSKSSLQQIFQGSHISKINAMTRNKRFYLCESVVFQTRYGVEQLVLFGVLARANIVVYITLKLDAVTARTLKVWRQWGQCNCQY